MANRDGANKLSAVSANDKATELVQLVIDWYRGNRNALSTAQQSAAITEITNVLNNTDKV